MKWRASAKFATGFDKATEIPVVGASAVPVLNERAQVDLIFSDDAIALGPMGLHPGISLSARVSSETAPEVWDAFAGSRLAVSGTPRGIQTDGGGK